MTEREALKLALEALESAEPKYTKQRADQKTLGGSLDYWKLAQHQRLKAVTAIKEVLAQPEQEPTYTSTQATNCAGCGEHKHTPLRIDAMGGYVCLTCIDKKLGSLLGEFGYAQPPVSETHKQEPVAWRDHVEQRLLTWRQSFVNKSGDQLALDDFMDKRSLDDLIDFVCDEYTTPPQRKPLTDEQIDAAVKAWFENDIVPGRQQFARRMRAAIEAAHGIKEKNT